MVFYFRFLYSTGIYADKKTELQNLIQQYIPSDTPVKVCQPKAPQTNFLDLLKEYHHHHSLTLKQQCTLLNSLSNKSDQPTAQSKYDLLYLIVEFSHVIPLHSIQNVRMSLSGLLSKINK